MDMAWRSTPSTGPHSEFTIYILLNLSRIPHNHILNESPLSWHSFQYSTKSTPLVHQKMLPLLLIYLSPKIPACACSSLICAPPPENFNGGKLCNEIGLSASKIYLLKSPLFGDMLPLLPVLVVLKSIFLLMNSPHHCPSTIM